MDEGFSLALFTAALFAALVACRESFGAIAEMLRRRR
jgi:hypothetical protein